MNAPSTYLTSESINTARAYGLSGNDATGFALLSSLAREPRLPLWMRERYARAREAMCELATLIANAVEARELSLLSTVHDAEPANSTQSTPTTHDIDSAATGYGARNVAVSNLGRNCYSVVCRGLDAEQREGLRQLLTDRFGVSICVEERTDT